MALEITVVDVTVMLQVNSQCHAKVISFIDDSYLQYFPLSYLSK